MAHSFSQKALSILSELIASVRHYLRVTLLTIVSPSGFLCSLYYTLFSSAFRREQKAVVSGMLRNAKSKDEDALIFRLRRNVHRIEKGLMMRPRRAVFALSYISAAVDCYVQLKAKALKGDGQELCWARDVLSCYFAAVSSHPTIDRARNRFESVEGTDCQDMPSRIPYKRNGEGELCSFESFLKLAKRRRSIRWFEKKPVPRELLDKALTAALEAPSACNRQPFSFRFFDDPVKVQSVAALPMGTSGFADNIPVICAVCGDLTAYSNERDRHGIYVDASLAAMSFMLALETLGLASCALNWPDMKAREKRITRLLSLNPEQRVIMLIAIGFADPECPIAFSQKKTLDQVRSFNECN